MQPARFCEILEQLFWSQRAVATMLECTEASVRFMANGSRSIPREIAEWLEACSRFHAATPPPGNWRQQFVTGIPKYMPLQNFLANSPKDEIQLSFRELEDETGLRLPPSAYNDQRWWDNSDSSYETHSQCRAWRNAGFMIWEADLREEHVEFRRNVSSKGAGQASSD